MGRGRAKAKQTKVARELKYRSMNTDFTSLERELRGAGDGPDIPPGYEDEVPPGYEDLVNGQGEDDDDGYSDLRKSG
ncbi:MAG: DUF3073 domain-containing protein [Microlunatus sp.]|nr:DUF3073 domain-containing protein [Microlunatus sp.]MDN5771069.1 DUF3073 domain-containing protein [Microlunatus sp.]